MPDGRKGGACWGKRANVRRDQWKYRPDSGPLNGKAARHSGSTTAGLGGKGRLFFLYTEGTCGYNISGAVSATLSGSIGLNVIHPDVLEVTGGIRGGGTFSVAGGCDEISVSGCVGPPNVFGTVTFASFITKEVSTDVFDTLIACF